MVGKPGRSGRPFADKRKGRQVGFRLDDDLSDAFNDAVRLAAAEMPLGAKFTQSDYLRGLFLRDAVARGLVPEATARGLASVEEPPPKPPPATPKPKRSGKT